MDGRDQGAVRDLVTEQVLPSLRLQILQLEGLGHPAGDQETLDALYADATSVLTSLEQDPSPLVRSLGGHGASPLDDVDARLTAYGLTACGLSAAGAQLAGGGLRR